MKSVAMLFLLAGAVDAQEPLEFDGIVRSSDGSTAVVVAGPYSYNYEPRLGDVVTFQTRIPGVGWADVRGEWKVSRILPETRTVAVTPLSPQAVAVQPSDRARIRTSSRLDGIQMDPAYPPLVRFLRLHQCQRAAELLRHGVDRALATAALQHVRHCPDLLAPLLAAHADPNQTQPGEAPALHVAVATGDPDAVRALLHGGADPNRRGYNGQTALIRAIEARDVELIRLLLEGGANGAIGDDKNLTAADYARDTRNPEIMRLIDPRSPLPAGEPAQPARPRIAAPGPASPRPEAVGQPPARPFPSGADSGATGFTLRHAHPAGDNFFYATAVLTLPPGAVAYRETADDAKPEHQFTFPCSEFREARFADMTPAERSVVMFLKEPLKLRLRAKERYSQLFDEKANVAEIVRAINSHCGK